MVHDAMKNFDHYEAARDLISCLNAEGYLSDASNLQAAMEEGATGTEIFMALKFHLSELVLRVPLTGESKQKAARLLLELNNALD